MLSLSSGLALAQTPNPKFEYGKEEEAKELQKVEGVEWKAGAAVGLVVTTGNSETTTLSGSATASRKEGNNKVELKAEGAYARSTIFIAQDLNSNGVIDSESELRQERQTTAQQWLVRGRYDRFLTLRNTLFASAAVGANEPAGKELIGNGQLGYSRLIVKDETHEIAGEIGYDYTFEKLDAAMNDELNIHSARAFLGYKGKVSNDTEVTGAVEVLVNLNEVELPTQTAEFAEDTRVNGSAGLTTKLFEDISFRFGFTVLYDNAPASRPAFGIPYGGGFLPEADKVDTRTDASLIINFL